MWKQETVTRSQKKKQPLERDQDTRGIIEFADVDFKTCVICAIMNLKQDVNVMRRKRGYKRSQMELLTLKNTIPEIKKKMWT